MTEQLTPAASISPFRLWTVDCRPFSSNSLSFKLLSKNASANHLESHSCKNKGLKVPCFHTLTKNIGGRGSRISCFDFRVSSPNFRLSTVNRPSGQDGRPACPESRRERAARAEGSFWRGNSFRITYIRKNASANPYGSHISKTKDLKPFRITYLQKKGRGRGASARMSHFRLSTVDCQLTTHQSLVTTHATEVS
jgi:hypothetical protein